MRVVDAGARLAAQGSRWESSHDFHGPQDAGAILADAHQPEAAQALEPSPELPRRSDARVVEGRGELGLHGLVLEQVRRGKHHAGRNRGRDRATSAIALLLLRRVELAPRARAILAASRRPS